jgi:transcriptional regulator with XRE-family HTH domain
MKKTTHNTMHTQTDTKAATPKRTGKRFGSVAELLKQREVAPEVRQHYKEMAGDTTITRQLACLRMLAGFTQAEMAEKLGVTQGCVSKWESGSDEELTLKVIADYARATNERIGICLGKPLTHVEAVKAYAFALRDRLRALASLAKDDSQLEQSIHAFFGEAFFNLLNIFENCQKEMPGQEDFEIRVLIDPPAQRMPQKEAARLPVPAFAA